MIIALTVTEKDAERISRRITIDLDTGCWLFPTGQKDGYARVKIKNRQAYVHRATYTYCRGPIPDELTLDHVKAWGCQHRSCCNPSHLEPVTLEVNQARAFKTHCKRGHEFTPENTLILSTGSRACRACAKERVRTFKNANPDYDHEKYMAHREETREANRLRCKKWYYDKKQMTINTI